MEVDSESDAMSERGEERGRRSPSQDGSDHSNVGLTEESQTRWYLYSLEIENFKSYRGRVKVGPMKPFMAIIGPNGSGKSNLMDAISFVMGERTSSLRVRRLNELTHGASVGKPLSLPVTVTATFKEVNVHNPEGEHNGEVQFTRAIRGNSSEYVVNGKVVNQHQYFEQLQKLGINVKAKNLLVFQGAIESIALKNSKERCALLEEICGSNSLKEEYEQAKANLADLEKKIELACMKKKAVTLERREAKLEIVEAQTYNDLLEKQSEKEIQLSLFKLYHLENAIDNLMGDVRLTYDEQKTLNQVKKSVEISMKDKKKVRGEMTRMLGTKEKALNTAEKERNNVLPKLITLEQKMKHLTKNLKNAEKSFKQASESHENQSKDLHELRKSLTEIQSQEQVFLNEHADLQVSQGVDVSFRESQMNEYWELKKEALSKTQKEKDGMADLLKQKKDTEAVLYSMNGQKQKLESKLQIVAHEIEEKKKFAKTYFETSEELKLKLASKESEVVVLREEVEIAEENVEAYRKEQEKLLSEIDTAKVGRHETAKKKQQQQAIVALQEHFPGVMDRVTHLCKIRHPKFKIAITKIMRKNMQAIVVDTEKTARDCIRYLKEQLLPPEVFLPLDLLEVKPLRTHFREKQTDEIYLAHDLLDFKSDIQKAILNCVKSTVVCKTPEIACHVASGKIFDEAVNAVSLDGTFFATSGIISAGTVSLQKKAQSWDDDKIAKMEKRKNEIYADLREAMKSSRKRTELDILDDELKSIRNQLNCTQEDFQKQLKAAKQLELDKERLSVELQDVTKKYKEFDAKNANISNALKKIQKKMHHIEDQLFRPFCEEVGIAHIRIFEERDVREQEEYNRQKTDFQRRIQQIQMKIEYEAEQQQLLESNKQRWKKTLAELRSQLDECKKEEVEIQKSMEKIDARMGTIRDDVDEAKRSIDSQNDEISALNKEQLKIQKALSQKDTVMTRLRSSLMEAKLNRHEVFKYCKLAGVNIPISSGSLENVESSLNQTELSNESGDVECNMEDLIKPDFHKLSMELKKLALSESRKETEQNLETELKQLEERIGSIQAPNMKANQKWDDINAKVREQQAEFDELRKDMKVVQEKFHKIKQERHNKFMTCFKKISHKIESIYKDLTQHQSAQAVLGLDNPEEPYLGGISYHCVAPMKRFQPMSNLSGGEKTLAAIALLFAIQRFEPAPFFVLDEIDAALDITNIGKVSSYIKRNAKHLQILVISLKLEFFEHADALLGVAPDPRETQLSCSNVYTLDLQQYPEKKSSIERAEN